MLTRRAWLLLLFACTAFGDDHADLRKLIEAHWGENGGTQVEITFPANAPKIPSNAILSVESATGGCFGHYAGLVRYEQVWDGRVRVRQISNSINLHAGTPAEFGATIGVGFLSRAQYDALIQDLLLIRAAKFRWRDAKPRARRWLTTSSPIYSRTRIRLASILLADERGAESRDEWNSARAWIYADRIERTLQECAVKPAPLSAIEAAVLLNELIEERAGERRWGNAIEFRIHVLGAIGYAPAAVELGRIAKSDRFGDSFARKSLRQIELLNADDPKASLLAALDEPSKRAHTWTKSLVRQLYRDEYKRSVLARFRRGEVAALLTIRSLAEDASELKERGLTLSRAGKRASAAAAEWEITMNPKSLAELIAITRDKALVSDVEFPVRVETITLLQRIAPAKIRVRNALLMMVVDITDDVRVRDQAARALREYGDARTIEVLTAQQAHSPSAVIAETLRALAAK